MTFFSTGHNYFTDGANTKYKEYTTEEANNFLNANEHDLTDLYNIKQILLALGQTTDPLTDERWFNILFKLISLLLINQETQANAYEAIEYLADRLDYDQLLEQLMDKLICFEWDHKDDKNKCLEIAKEYTIYIELFGRAIEKISRPKEWMLYLPFLTNRLQRTMESIESVLINKCAFFQRKKPFSNWDQSVLLVVGCILDFTEFVHSVTVSQSPSEFRTDYDDIGLQDGDVILNLDMQLSNKYFEKHYSKYSMKRSVEQQEDNEHMLKLTQRCVTLANTYEFSYEKMFQLLNSIKRKQSYLPPDEEVIENDRQMINARLYPLNYEGIASLLSISLYNQLVSQHTIDMDAFDLAKTYIGILIHLMMQPSDRINTIDKAIFVALYISDKIHVNLSMEDIETIIEGPAEIGVCIPVTRIFQAVSSVASTCPDSSIRFFAYHLVRKFLAFGNEQVKVFLYQELLVGCPFPSMKTAAIGILKDQIDQSFQDDKSVFASPLVIDVFFPLIFKVNKDWSQKPSEFWNDYSHVMQALNLYYYLLLKDKHNKTAIWTSQNINKMNKEYLTPIRHCLDTISVMPINNDNQMYITQTDLLRDSLDKVMQVIKKGNLSGF
ncbi:hypothetical protein RMATCC62417_16892 [Rhizopus microsporus]|nr:hypothetical protein RMATCC62417_16892 [Rhizopus microsporus]